MSTYTLKKIQKKEIQRQEIISQILEKKKMVMGSFCQIFVRCGKKNCHCINNKGHPQWRMSLKEDGKAFSRAVPSLEHGWIQEMTNNYSEYRKLRKELNKLNKEIEDLLDVIKDDCLEQTKKGKAYLDLGEKVGSGTK